MAHRIHVSTRLHRLLALTLLLLMTGCSLAEPLIRGVVVEEGSNKPLAGVVVFARWVSYGSAAGVDSRTSCVRIDLTTSDAQGRFELPTYSPLFPWGNAAASVHGYQQGYEHLRKIDQHGHYVDKPPPAEQRIVMKPFTGSVKERLEYLLDQTGKECGSNAKEIKTKIIPFYRALYEEAKAVARSSPRPLTEEERNLASMTLYHAEKYEFGMDEATKRLKARSLRGEY
jgi:hypothetical protein